MKRTFFTLALAFAGMAASAQNNVGINNTNPDPSAVLDVSSSNQGVLVPRMQSWERNNIQSPALGLMVFDIDENGFYYFDGTSWSRVGDNLGNHTATMDLDMGNSEIRNASRMAIGTPVAAAGAALDVSSTTSTFLPPRMTTAQRDALATIPDGSMIYNVDVRKWQGGYSYAPNQLYISHSNVTAFNPIASGQTMGQTFSSPSSAPLSSITLNLTYGTWATGSITCKLYTAPGGTLLATSSYTSPLGSSYSFNPDFPFTGVTLTASTSYYVEFTVTYSGHTLYHYYNTNTYSGGQAYYNNVADASKDLPIQVNFPATVSGWNDLN